MTDPAGCARRRASRVRSRVLRLAWLHAVLVVFVALAHAPSALAQLPDIDVADAIVAEASPASAPIEAAQLAEQAASVAQAAGAEAAALQEGAVDVIAPAVVASPGAGAVVEQANKVAAGADTTNANTVEQELDQSQVAGGSAAPSGGGEAQGQAGAQAAQTSQVASAQAVVVQNQPVNIAIPIIVNSPNSESVVVQTNSAAAAAGAANESSTTQLANQAQLGTSSEGGRTSSGPGAPVLPADHTVTPPGGASVPTAVQEAVPGPTAQPSSVWIWIWNSTWNLPEVSVPNVGTPWISGGMIPPLEIDVAPSLVDLASAVDATVLPELAGLVGAPPKPSGNNAGQRRPGNRARGSVGIAQADGAPWRTELERPGTPSLSSSPVHVHANADRSRDRRAQPADPSLPLPLPKHSAPAGSGGASVSPFGFVLGALLILAFHLASVAFALSRRFDLASAAWRRQAYLSPLERPG
jgi:hypothetical protein